MSQNSLVLPTTGTVSGLTMTQDTNAALDTLNTLWSGASAPGSPEAGQLWHDTTANILKLRSLDNTTWISLSYLNEAAYLAGPPSLGQVSGSLNRLLNSGMAIDQVNEGASYSIPNNDTTIYTADQWIVTCSNSTVAGITAQQVSDAPAGFKKSLKVTVGTGASSVASFDFLEIWQPIEGNNVDDLNYGTVNAQPVSLSFWVKSSVTGLFTAVIQNAAGNRSILYPFTIASAGTWQLVTLSNIAGEQTGTWGTGTSQSLTVFITAACGSGYTNSTTKSWLSATYFGASGQNTGVLTTSGATFQITGAMLNAGAFCQPYEKRTIQSELFLLQRYYEKSYDIGAVPGTASASPGALSLNAAASSSGLNVVFETKKRVDPTMVFYSEASGATGKIADITSSSDVSIANAFAPGHSGVSTSFASTSGHVYGLHWTANARM